MTTFLMPRGHGAKEESACFSVARQYSSPGWQVAVVYLSAAIPPSSVSNIQVALGNHFPTQ